MKYQLRKCEKYTSWMAGPVADFDPEDFRNHENNPYEGNSEEEFMNYIHNFEIDDVDGLSDSTIDELYKLSNDCEMTEYSNSAWKYADIWFEIGEANEEYRKTGGFDARHDTYQS
jgi:hypothetical protein